MTTHDGASPTLLATLLLPALVLSMITGCGPADGATGSDQGDDISGVVTGSAGPEAGVWVIAETRDVDALRTHCGSPRRAPATKINSPPSATSRDSARSAGLRDRVVH